MKTEARRRKTQSILKALEDKADERMKKLDQADRIREMKIKQKRDEALAKARRKAESSARRIKAAVDAGNKALEDKRKRVEDKNAAAAIVREQREQEKEEQRLAMIQRNQEKNESRKELLEQVYERERERIQRFERHLIENQGHIAEVRAREAEHRAIVKAKVDSRIQAKIENVKRRKRKSEFRRLQILQKLEMEEQRQKELNETKKRLKAQRKKEEVEAMLRKTNLKKSMDYIRATAKWNLIEFLDDTGKINRRRRRKKKGVDGDDDEEKDKVDKGETM